MLYVTQTALLLGCIYAIVSLALFISFRILNIADLTTDGCFVLGMAVSVSASVHGHPILGLFLAMLAGCAAGAVTALLQTRCGVPAILAGLVTNTGLYTMNLMAMGWSSNINILKQETVYTLFRSTGIGGSWYNILLSFVIMALFMVIIRLFLATRLGLSVRATGDNPDMVAASSIDPRKTILIGLVIANSLTALAGALIGQMQKTADINGGTGIVVIGLACLIIGETVIGRGSLTRNIIACFIGNFVYRMIYAVILQTRIIPVDCLKLMTALIVALAIALPTIRENAALYRRIREEGHRNA